MFVCLRLLSVVHLKMFISIISMFVTHVMFAIGPELVQMFIGDGAKLVLS